LGSVEVLVTMAVAENEGVEKQRKWLSTKVYEHLHYCGGVPLCILGLQARGLTGYFTDEEWRLLVERYTVMDRECALGWWGKPEMEGRGT
jgi:hypothetical protein